MFNLIRSYHTVFPSRFSSLHSKNVWTIYCSIFLSTGSVLSFSVLILFFCHSNEDKVGSHHFNLHFLVDEWSWATFSVFLGLTSLWFVHFSCLGFFFFFFFYSSLSFLLETYKSSLSSLSPLTEIQIVTIPSQSWLAFHFLSAT